MSYLKSVLAQCWTPDPIRTAANIQGALINLELVHPCDIDRLEKDALIYLLYEDKKVNLQDIAARVGVHPTAVYKMFYRHRKRVRHKLVIVA